MSRINLSTKYYVLLPLLFGFFLSLSLFITLRQHVPSTENRIWEGNVISSEQPLPQSRLRDTRGNVVSPEILTKDNVLLFYFTSKCGACRQESRIISDLETHLSKRVRVYAVTLDNEEEIDKFVSESNFNTPIFIDENRELLKQMSIKYFPTKFMIENGTVKKIIIGGSSTKESFLEKTGLRDFEQ